MSGIKKILELIDDMSYEPYEGLFICAGCGEELDEDEAFELSGSYFHEECYMDAGSQLREI